MTLLKLLTISLALINMAACGTHPNLVKVELLSHSGVFTFVSSLALTNTTGHAWYESKNPLCTQVSAGFHGQDLLSMAPRHQSANIVFDAQRLFVPQTQPSRAWCNYELVNLQAIVNLTGAGSGTLHIHADEDAPTEVEIYCQIPPGSIPEFSCREKMGCMRIR